MKKAMNIFTSCVVVTSLVCLNNVFAKELEAGNLSEKTDFLQSIGVLNIMAEDESVFEQAVSRGEFISSIMHMVYPNENYEAKKGNYFIDVDDDTPYYGEINMAKEVGLVSGVSYNKFAPSEDMSVQDAKTVIKKILGYENLPEKIFVGTGIYEGVEKQTGVLIEKDLISLLYNSLEIDKVIYSGTNEYDMDSGITILNDNLKISTVTGIVDSNEYTGLYVSEGTTGSERFTVGGVEIYGEGNYDDLLGTKVKVFCKEDKYGENECVYIYDKDNKRVSANHDEISGFSHNTYSIVPDGTNKKKQYKLSEKSAIIYNGKACESLPNMIPKYGDIELIDNNRDNTFDVVKINDYKSVFSVGIYAEDYAIFADDGTTYTFDEDTIVYIDSKKAEFSSILPNSSVLYRESINSNGDKLRILDVSTVNFAGKITSKTEDEIKIGADSYKLNPYCVLDANVGEEGKYYIDAKGKLAYFLPSLVSSERYAYLFHANYDEGDSTGYMVIYNDSGVKELCEIGKSVILDGKSVDSEVACRKLAGRFELIRYKKTEDGRITYVDTPDVGANLEKVPYDGTAVKFMYRNRGKGFTERFDENGRYVNGPFIYFVDSTTKVFFRGADPSDLNKFKIGSIAEFTDGTELKLEAYDMDEKGICKAIVIDNSGAGAEKIYTYNYLYFVNEVVEKIDSDDEIYYDIRGIYSGASTSYSVDPEMFPQVTNIKPGDIIQFNANTDGQLTAIQYVYAKSGKVPEGFSEAAVYVCDENGSKGACSDTACVLFGQVEKKMGNVLQVKYKLSGAEKTGLVDGSIGTFILYDGKKFEVKPTRDIPAVMSGNQRLLAHIRSGASFELVVFDEKKE
ncbi:MAG: hypothetical protein J6N52_04405 [Clostridia bacterium]|nr:hypothetical protein [Clostridia bacterium]